ncbi:MAG: hypothetical protein NTW96_14635 [Planctomycetia bacterium]|nr:hypothetical protein [Planctomycetia bacterium]
MRFTLGILIAAVSVVMPGIVPGGAAAADLTFQPAGEGYFQFDTGVVRGKMQIDGKSQGIRTMVHVPSGKELAWGDPNPGILSYYRVLGQDYRYGDSPRHWPAQAKLLPDGALEITWPPAEERPFELKAVFRWVAPDTLDNETICTPQRAMPAAEVFLSSYFCEGSDTMVYADRSLYGQAKPGFLPADYCTLLEGTYLFFPRDREASRLIYDRRWEFPPNPVQWSVTQRLAAPMAMRRAAQGGQSVLLMSPPEDCFAIAVSYNRTPVDGVASHRSIYFSLFGRDLKPGEPASARMRMIVGDLSPEKAEELYARYREQIKVPAGAAAPK